MSCGYCTAPGGKCKGDCMEAKVARDCTPTAFKPPHAPPTMAQQHAVEDAYQRGYREGFADGVKHVTSTRAPTVRNYACVRRPHVPLSDPCGCDACELPYGP